MENIGFSCCSSFGSCTSLRPGHAGERGVPGRLLQFLRELHFIEARSSSTLRWAASSCSSFGSCTSLRLGGSSDGIPDPALQFLRKLHFIEAGTERVPAGPGCRLQFLWGLHFVEAGCRQAPTGRPAGCSSFGNCTSLRRQRAGDRPQRRHVAVLSGTALH